MGYGIAPRTAGGTSAPELTLSLSNDERAYGLGWRLGTKRNSHGRADLRLRATRHESDEPAPIAEHRIGIELETRF